MATDGYDLRDGDYLVRHARNGGFVLVRFEDDGPGTPLVARDEAFGDEEGNVAQWLADLLYRFVDEFSPEFSKHAPKQRGVFVTCCTYEQRERMLDAMDAAEGPQP